MQRAGWVEILARLKNSIDQAVPLLVGIRHSIEILIVEGLLFALSIYGAWEFFRRHF